jgi:hypothetical protein
MITLHLAINSTDDIWQDDIDQFEFSSTIELGEYLKELKMFDCVWIATGDGEKGDIIITENLDTILRMVADDSFKLDDTEHTNFFVQEYQTYEDAYAVALNMREGNPKCYNKIDTNED